MTKLQEVNQEIADLIKLKNLPDVSPELKAYILEELSDLYYYRRCLLPMPAIHSGPVHMNGAPAASCPRFRY